MPTDILMTDVRFPSEASLKGKKTDEKIGVITNYLYMLKEQLAYNMYHIGSSQLLPSVTDDITAPLFKHLEDQDGNITELQVTAKGLSTKVSNIEGDVASLNITADALTSSVEDAEGNITNLVQTSEYLSAQVESLDGQVSGLALTVDGAMFYDEDYKTTRINGDKITTGTISGDRLNVTKLNATSGTIALWNVSKDTIYSGNVGMYSGSGYTKASLVTSGSSSVRFFAGGAYNNGKFVVLEDGSLYASSAELTGSITIKKAVYNYTNSSGTTNEIGSLYAWYYDDGASINWSTESGYHIRILSGKNVYIYSTNSSGKIYIGVPSDLSTNDNCTTYFYGNVNFYNATVTGL